MELDLFEGDFETESFKSNGFYSYDDFTAFGTRIGIPPKRVDRIINTIIAGCEKMHDLLQRSFLPDRLKIRYGEMVRERAKAIGYSFAGTVLPRN